MAEGKSFQVVLTQSARKRYQQIVLSYLLENFSVDRAIEIDQKISSLLSTLERNPARGTKEKYLAGYSQSFRFILFKETRNLEIKIIYYISPKQSKVYVTDFFPTMMHPLGLSQQAD